MSVNLCIDWGNTNVKSAIFQDDQLVKDFMFSEEDAMISLSNIIDSYNPVKVIFCSVTNHPYEVEALLKERVKSYFQLDSNAALPIMNAYLSTETLGNDRLAIAVGAHLLFPDKNNLVISLGTCITYNFIQKNRAFRGGAISPGMQMRLDAMHHFTGKLPKVNINGELVLLGYDTATCMRSGAIFGMTAEIDGIIKEYESQYPDFNAVLTGGDAPFFVTRLKSKIFADPYIALRGLNLILKHNVPIPR